MADNVMMIWRNKKKEEELSDTKNWQPSKKEELTKKPCAMLICAKQRNGEWEGKFKLWFDKASLQYKETNDFQAREMW